MYYYTLPPAAPAWLVLLADDFRWMAGGRKFAQLLLRGLLIMAIYEVPVSWAKGRGGFAYDWIGLKCALARLQIPVAYQNFQLRLLRPHVKGGCMKYLRAPGKTYNAMCI